MTEKLYNLQVTEKQLQVISTACELLSRIQGGQVREAFDHLPLRKNIDWGVYHEIQDELTKRMPEILKDGIDGYRSSFGVGHSDLPESQAISWDLYQVIRYELSTQRAIDEGLIQKRGERKFPEMMYVSFDTPMKYGVEKLATIEKLNK